MQTSNWLVKCNEIGPGLILTQRPFVTYRDASRANNWIVDHETAFLNERLILEEIRVHRGIYCSF